MDAKNHIPLYSQHPGQMFGENVESTSIAMVTKSENTSITDTFWLGARQILYE